MNKICQALSQQQVEEFFIPLVIRLSKADWFTSKISATGLYTVAYPKASPQIQTELRSHYSQLVHDETPMVRRAAATNLGKFVKAMPSDVVIKDMIPLFQFLAGDEQDSVRLLTIEILIAIAEVVPVEQQANLGQLLQILKALFTDKSWRVRYMVADRFEKVRNPGSFRGGRIAKLLHTVGKSDRRGCRKERFSSCLRQAPEGWRGRSEDCNRRTNSW